MLSKFCIYLWDINSNKTKVPSKKIQLILRCEPKKCSCWHIIFFLLNWKYFSYVSRNQSNILQRKNTVIRKLWYKLGFFRLGFWTKYKISHKTSKSKDVYVIIVVSCSAKHLYYLVFKKNSLQYLHVYIMIFNKKAVIKFLSINMSKMLCGFCLVLLWLRIINKTIKIPDFYDNYLIFQDSIDVSFLSEIQFADWTKRIGNSYQ